MALPPGFELVTEQQNQLKLPEGFVLVTGKDEESPSMQAGRKADISIGGFPIGSSVQGAINALQGPNTKRYAITFVEQRKDFARTTQ